MVRAIAVECAAVIGEILRNFHRLCSQRMVVVTIVDGGRIPQIDLEGESIFGINIDVWKLFLQRIEFGWTGPLKLANRKRLLRGVSHKRQVNNKCSAVLYTIFVRKHLCTL